MFYSLYMTHLKQAITGICFLAYLSLHNQRTRFCLVPLVALHIYNVTLRITLTLTLHF